MDSVTAALDVFLGSEGLTAVATHNDDIGLLLASALQARGLEAGRDLAVIGVDNIPSARLDLTTVEIDVTEHLDLVRRFDVMRTPTVLVLDAGGVVVGRMSGALDRRHALAALESCPGTVSAR